MEDFGLEDLTKDKNVKFDSRGRSSGALYV